MLTHYGIYKKGSCKNRNNTSGRIFKRVWGLIIKIKIQDGNVYIVTVARDWDG